MLNMMSLDELIEERSGLEIRLSGAMKIPEFPPVEFKLNLGLVRDLQERLDRVNRVIQGRETLPI